MNLQEIINDIKSKIEGDCGMFCIYIGVGSAAHMVKDGKLEDLYYHQYPKFLENMHRDNSRLTTFHILIDTMMESPPFMTIDHSKGLTFNKINNNMYYSDDTKHIVYSLKETVTMCAYTQYNKYNDYTDITDYLHQLNNIAMEENVLLVYNDYSGRSPQPISEYFDKYIVDHLDHIIYGLGSRGNHGCYIDLLHPSSLFAYNIDYNSKRDYISVFNIYYLLYHKVDINRMIETYPLEHIEIISSSIDDVLKMTLEYYNNHLLYDMRILYQLMTQKAKMEEFNEHIILSMFENEEIKDNMREQNYELCFYKLVELYSKKLDIIIYLKQLETTSSKLMSYIIEDKNEYNWYTRLKSIVY